MKVTLIYNPDAGSDNQPTDEEILNLIRRRRPFGRVSVVEANRLGKERSKNLWTLSLYRAATGVLGKSPSA